jgi:hypothetical protein
MSENISDPHRQQQLFWNEVTRLKAAVIYIGLYRDSLEEWVTGLATLKALASSGGIAAWAIWKQYAFFWGAIIAASQLADAIKDVFPFAKRHKAASLHTAVLSELFIDAQLDWENIVLGKFTNDEIMKRVHRLRKMQLEAERENFPDGLKEKGPLLARAKLEAEAYFRFTYNAE